MTLTFTADPDNAHQTTLRRDCDLPDGLPVGEPVHALGNAEPAASLPGRPWRIAAALFSQLLGPRKLPPQDDHLRRDIGLPEREMRRDYRDYYWWDY